MGVKDADLRIAGADNADSRKIGLEVGLVTELSSGLDAIGPTTTHQFMRKTESMQGDIEDRPNAVDECPLIISRSRWFLMMAVLLGLVLLTPAVLLSCKRDSDAGSDLIAAIIGVATIRTVVLGTPNGWNFLPIDVFCRSYRFNCGHSSLVVRAAGRGVYRANDGKVALVCR